MNVLVLVVDDEPDVEALFRQQFRRDLRAQRFMMDFANSALMRSRWLLRDRAVADPDPVRHQHARHDRPRDAAQGQGIRPDVPVIMITAYGDADTRRKALACGATGVVEQADRFCAAARGNRRKA